MLPNITSNIMPVGSDEMGDFLETRFEVLKLVTEHQRAQHEISVNFF